MALVVAVTAVMAHHDDTAFDFGYNGYAVVYGFSFLTWPLFDSHGRAAADEDDAAHDGFDDRDDDGDDDDDVMRCMMYCLNPKPVALKARQDAVGAILVYNPEKPNHEQEVEPRPEIEVPFIVCV